VQIHQRKQVKWDANVRFFSCTLAFDVPATPNSVAKSAESETTIPIAGNLAEMLREFVGDRRDGLLFVNRAGRPYTSSGKFAQKKLWLLCDASKIPSGRLSCLSEYARNGTVTA
jgi:hypothetical protein